MFYRRSVDMANSLNWSCLFFGAISNSSDLSTLTVKQLSLIHIITFFTSFSSRILSAFIWSGYNAFAICESSAYRTMSLCCTTNGRSFMYNENRILERHPPCAYPVSEVHLFELALSRCTYCCPYRMYKLMQSFSIPYPPNFCIR